MDTPRRRIANSNEFHEKAAWTRDVQRDGNHVIVMFHGRPVSAHVPIQWYRDACTALGIPLVAEI